MLCRRSVVTCFRRSHLSAPFGPHACGSRHLPGRYPCDVHTRVRVRIAECVGRKAGRNAEPTFVAGYRRDCGAMASRDQPWQCLYPRRVTMPGVASFVLYCCLPSLLQVAASVCYVTVAYYLLRGRVRAPVPEEGSEDVFAAAATVATVTLEEPLLHSLNASGIAELRLTSIFFALSPVSHPQNPEAVTSLLPPCASPSTPRLHPPLRGKAPAQQSIHRSPLSGLTHRGPTHGRSARHHITGARFWGRFVHVHHPTACNPYALHTHALPLPRQAVRAHPWRSSCGSCRSSPSWRRLWGPSTSQRTMRC